MVRQLNKASSVTKRIQVTLPDSVAENLEKWADWQRRSVANLAAYLLEKAIDEAKEKKEFPKLEGASDESPS